MAAIRILALLPDRHTAPWLRMAAAAALVSAVGLSAWIGARSSALAPGATAMATPPLPDNVVVFWVAPETPVYFVLSPLGSQMGDVS